MLPITARLALTLCLLAGMFALAPAPAAYAAGTIYVTTAADEDLNNTACSLREAILAANTDLDYRGCAGAAGDDTILFQENYTITLNDRLPTVTSIISITGNGRANTVIQANAAPNVGTYGIFVVGNGSLSLTSLTLRNGRCTASGCGTGGGYSGAAIFANTSPVHIDDVAIEGNSTELDGGAIALEGTSATITNSTFANNVAKNRGGAINVHDSDVTITNTTFTNNSTTTGTPSMGGALYSDIDSSLAATVDISGSTFTANSSKEGGAIAVVSGAVDVGTSSFSANSAGQWGGAINVDSAGGLTVHDSTFDTNQATSASFSTRGGAIYNDAGIVSVYTSLFKGNSAKDGGALYNYTTAPGTGSLEVINSTLTTNQAVTGDGGAIYNNYNASVFLTHDTFSANQAPNGGALVNNGSAWIINTIMSDSTGGGYDCYNLPGSGTVTNVGSLAENNGYNPINCGNFQLNDDPSLGGLGAYGGPTQSMPLQPGSKAIDAANSPSCQDYDQRGTSRPQGLNCDIGAYELDQTQLMVYSQAAKDGWILESTEGSGAGGLRNYGQSTLIVGDSASDQQYRSILSFNTASIPEGAYFTFLQVKIRKESVVGTNPFNTHGNLKLDMRNTFFASTSELQLADFKALASLPNAGILTKPPVDGWYGATFSNSAYAYVNTVGVTQFRLRFATDDNDDMSADYVRFYSGNSAADKPVLIIYYYVAP